MENKWTTTAPNDFGYFWWKRADGVEPTVVKVAGTHGGIRVYFHNCLKCDSPSQMGGVWSQRIEY